MYRYCMAGKAEVTEEISKYYSKYSQGGTYYICPHGGNSVHCDMQGLTHA